MQAQPHPLEPFFQQIVRNSYEGKLGLHDPDLTVYVARILCEFSQADKLYSMRDASGRPIEEIEEMERAADPILGTAASFDAERALRKYIGDYSLFVAGMYPEATGSSRRHRRKHPSIDELDSRRQAELLHRQPVQPFRIRAGSAALRAPFQQL